MKLKVSQLFISPILQYVCASGFWDYSVVWIAFHKPYTDMVFLQYVFSCGLLRSLIEKNFSHKPHTDMVFLQYVFCGNALWALLTTWNICHKLYIGKVSHPCVFWCGLLSAVSGKDTYHKLYTGMAFHQCVFWCDLLGVAIEIKIYHKLCTGMVFGHYVFSSAGKDYLNLQNIYYTPYITLIWSFPVMYSHVTSESVFFFYLFIFFFILFFFLTGTMRKPSWQVY